MAIASPIPLDAPTIKTLFLVAGEESGEIPEYVSLWTTEVTSCDRKSDELFFD